jgi:hypothetical protein
MRNADDLTHHRTRLRRGRRSQRDARSDRRSPSQVFTGERFIHDADLRAAGGVTVVEGAAGDDRDAEGGEVGRADDLKIRGRRLVLRKRLPTTSNVEGAMSEGPSGTVVDHVALRTPGTDLTSRSTSSKNRRSDAGRRVFRASGSTIIVSTPVAR